MNVALSSGCFIGHENCIADAEVRRVELSGHRVDGFKYVLDQFRTSGTKVVGVHSPCPVRKAGVNLGASGALWQSAKQELFETGDIACGCHADYVLVHAFYCIPGDLPADDLARMKSLRRLFRDGGSIAAYVASETYQSAKSQAIRNIRSLLPAWRRRFPRQKIVLENLNPRIGYGGIAFQDVADIAKRFDGDVGICLDMGHLTLAQAALGVDVRQGISEMRDLIWSAHAHDNFAGRFYVDRKWDANAADPSLQEVDIHLPFMTRYRRATSALEVHVKPDNCAFEGVLEGGVHYMRPGFATSEPSIKGSVPVDELLRLLSPDINVVLEFDSRYAPLSELLEEYHLANRGEHPLLRGTNS